MNCNELQENTTGERYMIKRPKALQWFHNGRLVKESDEERQAGRFELFLDLLYVAIVANFSDDLAENPDGQHLAKYILIFAPAWHIWVDLREIMNSYYTDDLLQRLVILWVMALLVLYANNARLVDQDLSAMQTTAGAYVVARFTTMCAFLVCSFASYQHRAQARIMALFMFIGLFITIPLFFEQVSIEAKIAVVAVIIFYQEVTWSITLSPWIKRKLRLTYSTAVDIAHEIDRMAAFFIIILGEFVYSVIVGDPAGVGLTQGYAKAAFTLIIAFCLNWIYVSGDGSLEATHPIRRSAWTAFGFFLLHLPLSASFLIGGHIAAISTRLDEFEDGQRWLLGGGLGVGMFCLWIYGMLYRTHDEDCLILSKTPRIGMRLVVAIILLALPATNDGLSTTDFMAIVMSLFAFLVIWETIGGLLKGAQLFEPWVDRNPPIIDGEASEEDLSYYYIFQHQIMSSIPRIRAAQREVSKHVNAASLPNVIHKPGEEARGIHPRNKTSVTSLKDAYINASYDVESDTDIASKDITGECSSPPVTIQEHPETSDKTTTNLETTIPSTEDMDEAQEPSDQSFTDGAQSTAERLRKAAEENPMLAAATIATGAGVAVMAAPVLITAPIMGLAAMAGFTPAGIAGASIASAVQAGIGNVAAGSLFATIQSAAMGGYGVAAMAGSAQAVGGAVAGAGGISTAWTWLKGKPKAESPEAGQSKAEPPKQ
ncbi:bacterial low temperature requirement A domain-containing protein [Trichoderma austrokoningii]